MRNLSLKSITHQVKSLNSNPSIRMIPELNIAALSRKPNQQTRELLFWYLLRTINVTGCGHVLLADAEREFTTTFKYTRRTFYRHLSLGKGKLWDFYDNGLRTIKIYSLATACEYFHTYKGSKWVDIDTAQLLKHPSRAMLWNAGAYRANANQLSAYILSLIHI